MLKFKLIFISILALFISTYGCASEERYRTGFVLEISESRIKLDLQHTGMISHIGFLCEPNVCESTHKIKVGDEVLLTLGSVDRKNKLLSIRKCVVNDTDCNRAKKIGVKEETERKKASDLSFKKHEQCREKMNKDLVSDSRFFSGSEEKFSNDQSEQVRDQYNGMLKTPNHKECLNKFVKSHQDALLEACLKHECGQNIGGGCYHIIGYSVTTSVLSSAIEQCSI